MNNNSLYHYTDASAVQSMLVHRKLWLTDLRFMNDSTELLHGIEFLMKALKNQPYGLFYNLIYAEHAVDYLNTSLNLYQDATRLQDPVFSMSFSEKHDLLSQWRGYGGYAVRFDRQCLEDAGISLLPCIYDTRSKHDHSLVNTSDAGAKISRAMGEHDGALSSGSFDAVVDLIKTAARFKHSGFAEEQEVRMILQPDDSKIKYRPRGGMLIPYIEVDIPEGAITGVQIGPIRDQALATLSMEMFARSVERAHRSNGGSIEWDIAVTKSETPYRD
ncbi:TPA: DUF2971 domain-containing protein [Stenotrophomonas maltophilia]|nr:DUF2971 domain-containing protein [Stenotrophomonas maltophilia]HDS1043680.1 DUF2971 domain-containing protein [Stenotrophomonas maltophilia]